MIEYDARIYVITAILQECSPKAAFIIVHNEIQD